MMQLRTVMASYIMIFGAGCTETPPDDERHSEIVAPERSPSLLDPAPGLENHDRADEAARGEDRVLLD